MADNHRHGTLRYTAFLRHRRIRQSAKGRRVADSVVEIITREEFGMKMAERVGFSANSVKRAV